MHADLESIVCKFGGEEAICAKVYRQTDGQTDDGSRAIALAHSWNELKIGKAKTVFGTLKNLLLSLATRLKVLKCYVWSVLFYGCETWTILKAMKDRLMEVMAAAGVQRVLMKTIRQRQLSCHPLFPLETMDVGDYHNRQRPWSLTEKVDGKIGGNSKD